jgi:hypothetical protein
LTLAEASEVLGLSYPQIKGNGLAIESSPTFVRASHVAAVSNISRKTLPARDKRRLKKICTTSDPKLGLRAFVLSEEFFRGR